MAQGALIVTHGDIDGIITGYVLKKWEPSARMYFTDGNKIYRIFDFISQYKRIYVSDIPPDTRTPELTKKLLNHRAVRKWYDHHNGWKEIQLSPKEQEKIKVDPTAPSTASLIPDAPVELVEMANIADSKTDEKPKEIQLIIQALRLNPRDVSTKYEVMGYLSLLEKAGKYVVKADNTQKLLDQGKKYGEILVVDLSEIPQADTVVDRTKIFFDGYNIAPYVVIVSIYNGRKGLTVGTNQKINLQEILEQPGLPQRVTIPYQDNYIDYLATKLPRSLTKK